MNKKTLMVGGLTLSALILTGCFGKGNTEKKDSFEVAACNEYIEFMRCVAEKAGDTSASSHAIIDQAITSWKALPNDQLELVCTQAISNITEYASTYEQIGCALPASAQVSQNQDDMLSGDITIEDQAIVDAITGEVDNTTGTNINPSTGTTAQEDAQVISGIIDNISGSTQE